MGDTEAECPASEGLTTTGDLAAALVWGITPGTGPNLTRV